MLSDTRAGEQPSRAGSAREENRICYSCGVRKVHSSAWRLAILSAVLQVVIFPLPNLYWLSWIAVVPLLIALRRAQAPETMHKYGGLAIPVALLVLIVACMYMGLYHGLFGLLLALTAGKASQRRALVLAPFLWVAVELARTRISAFPWELLGYTQTNNPALTRLATLTGVYGLSFEIMLVNCVFAAAFLVAKERRKLLLAAASGAALLLQAGQLLSPPAVATDHNALLVQPNIPAEG